MIVWWSLLNGCSLWKRDKEIIQQQIDATDRQIDKLVYKLYGLTEEEIKIVVRKALRWLMVLITLNYLHLTRHLSRHLSLTPNLLLAINSLTFYERTLFCERRT